MKEVTVTENEGNRVDFDTAREMAYAVDSDGTSVNQLRSVAAAARKEGLREVGELLDVRAEPLEIEAGLAHIAMRRAGQEAEFAAMEARVRGSTGEESLAKTSELEQKAAEAIAAMQEKFPGATFELVRSKDGAWVVCSDPNGIDFGNPKKDYDPARSWDAVMAATDENTERFTITVGKLEYDTREGMTEEAYGALVGAKKAACEELPDSEANRLNGRCTWTFLTGEWKGDTYNMLVANVGDDGRVRQAWTPQGANRWDLRVRPAVKIA